MSGWTEGDVSVGDVNLHYYRRGSGSPLVLAHGMSDNGECWTRVAEALEDEFDIVAFDARYHGKSDAPPPKSGDGASDLIGLVETLGLTRPAVMGHSMGAGSVATALADRPDLFARAVLEDGGLGMPRSLRPQPAADGPSPFVTWLQGLRELSEEAVIEQGRKSSPAWHESEFGPWARAKKQFRPPDDFGSMFASRQPRSLEETADTWGCPVLALAAETSRGSIVTDEAIEIATTACPTLEVVRLPAGHNVRREAFEEFVSRVRTFLRS